MFCFIRFAQLVSVPLFDIVLSSSVPATFWLTWNLQTTLPWQLLKVHTIIASVMCLIDIMEIVVPFISGASQLPEPLEKKNQQKISPKQPLVNPSTTTVPAAGMHRAFELDTRSRPKLMMTFNGHSRWPTMLNVDKGKKTT